MKINEVLKFENVGKVFKCDIDNREFILNSEKGILQLKDLEDPNIVIEEVYHLHLLLISNFERVKTIFEILEEERERERERCEREVEAFFSECGIEDLDLDLEY